MRLQYDLVIIFICCYGIGECSSQEQLSAPVGSPLLMKKSNKSSNRSFTIDFDNDQFLKDGEPFQYISGSFHYFRVPRQYWRDRLRKFRAAGLNGVSTYVEWSFHEPSPGKYKFSGDQDLEYFIQVAVEEDLLVILRPGPYICAERDFGGFPPWLLTLHPDIELRTKNQDYKIELEKWFRVLFHKLRRYWYGKGGPIIMVENEYGGYHACDREYMIWLRDLMKSYVKENAVLFTCGGAPDKFFECGTIPGVYTTVNFGPWTDAETAFTSVMRRYQEKGPLVNSEFYPGWLSNWEHPMQKINTSDILRVMEQMFRMNASFNFYMFFGGTNFGFTSGANVDGNYQPQLTSYDYDAPLDEAGDPTEKYYAIRKLISKHVKLPDLPVPKRAPKGACGIITLKPVISLFDHVFISDVTKHTSIHPKTFEELNIPYGYILYETIIPSNIPDPAILHLPQLKDRAIVYVDKVARGILSRTRRSSSLPLVPGEILSILVENQGRVNYGSELKDKKGLLETPTLDGRKLRGWNMTTFPFESVDWVEDVDDIMSFNDNIVQPPAYYYGELELPSDLYAPLDTYVDLSGWGKGVVFINGRNLGRYWPRVGSQITLYVPGCYLKAAPEKNKIVVFETEVVLKNRTIQFVQSAKLDKIPPFTRS